MARSIDNRIIERETLDFERRTRVKEIELEKTLADLEASGSGDLLASNNLSDVADAATARSNIGAAATVKTVTTQTGNYTVLATDEVVLVNGTYTMTLPTAVGVTGKVYTIKNIGTGIATVDGDGSETIDSNTTVAISPDEALKIVSDGTEWWII